MAILKGYLGETKLLSFRKRKLVLLLASLLLISLFRLGINPQPAKSGFAMAAASPHAEKNVILLGWDGVQRNHLFELIDRGLMPNLSSFMQDGRMVNITITDHFTDTKAGWTQILTGYKWWKTGVFNNFFWFHSIPRGYTIPERLENIFGKDQIVTAFIAGKLNHMETIDGTGSAAIDHPCAIYTHEAIYSNLPSQLDIVDVGDPNSDRYADVVGPLTLQFLQDNANNHFFAFFHFSDPDHIGHAFGEDSVEYENAIETCDYWLGQILAELDKLNATQNTLIYITADHGFDEGAFTHTNAPFIFFATNDKNVSRNGDEVDVASTVYYGLGLWNQSFVPELDGYPLQESLPAAEAQRREVTLVDPETIQTPTMSITDRGSDVKIVEFSATDNNLAAVLLLVDNTLKTEGPWNWTRTQAVTATGSYCINTTSLSPGLHTVKILAFDEHGANNGGPGNDPKNGGSPSINSIDFYTGIPPSHPPFPSMSPPLSPLPSRNPTSTLSSNTPIILSICLNSSHSDVGLKVGISGSATSNGVGFSGIPVLLSYSVSGRKAWNEIHQVTTSFDGGYSAIWMPSATGEYIVKAAWVGNVTAEGATAFADLAVVPFDAKNVFSVVSNSTISSLSFDSERKELSFTMTGASGTYGYADIFIAKTLMPNVGDVRAYLDGNPTQYTTSSLEDAYLLHFTNLHSSPNIVMRLCISNFPFEIPFITFILIGIPIAGICTGASYYFLRKKR